MINSEWEMCSRTALADGTREKTARSRFRFHASERRRGAKRTRTTLGKPSSTDPWGVGGLRTKKRNNINSGEKGRFFRAPRPALNAVSAGPAETENGVLFLRVCSTTNDKSVADKYLHESDGFERNQTF